MIYELIYEDSLSGHMKARRQLLNIIEYWSFGIKKDSNGLFIGKYNYDLESNSYRIYIRHRDAPDSWIEFFKIKGVNAGCVFPLVVYSSYKRYNDSEVITCGQRLDDLIKRCVSSNTVYNKLISIDYSVRFWNSE